MYSIIPKPLKAILTNAFTRIQSRNECLHSLPPRMPFIKKENEVKTYITMQAIANTGSNAAGLANASNSNEISRNPNIAAIGKSIKVSRR